MALKGIFLRVTFLKMSRYGIMATQLLATLTTNHHLLKREIVVYLFNFCHMFLIHHLWRVFCVSAQEMFLRLILWVDLDCSIFEDIDSCRASVYHHRVGWRSRKQRLQDQFEAMDHEDHVSFVSPLSSYLASWISRRDSCLVGVSCHNPRNWL